jgi:hypothetical protein
MSELTGKQRKTTYLWLVHFGQPGPLPATAASLYLGDGTELPVSIGSCDMAIACQTELTGQAATNGTSAMTRDLADSRYGRRIVVLRTTNSTAKASTTTFADDDQLIIPLPAGIWKINVIAVTNPNFKFRVKASAASIPNNSEQGYLNYSRTNTGGVVYMSFGGGESGYQTSTGGGTSVNGGGFAEFVHAHTAESVLTVQWTQITSSATGTILYANSAIIAEKLD